VGPCHYGMARPQVADGGTASNMEGRCPKSSPPPSPSILYYIVLHVKIQFVPENKSAAEIVRDLQIAITRFATRVSSRTGDRTYAVTFEDTRHEALGS
jgi:hypothetical protein